MTLNERLKIARKKAKKTQAQMANDLGVGVGSIKRYEKDASKIPVALVSKMAHLCDVDEIWLLTGREIETADSSPSNITVIEHKDLVGLFKDPEQGKKNNEHLIGIEEASPDLYKQVSTYLEATHNAAKTMKKETKDCQKKLITKSSERRRANGH